MDIYENTDGDIPFAHCDLWKPSELMFEIGSPLIHDLNDLDGLKKPEVPLETSTGLKLVFPGLDTFEYCPIEATTPSDSSSVSLHEKALEDNEIAENADLLLEAAGEEASNFQSLKTWESFYDRTFVEPVTYLSEAGPQVFDAALVNSETLPDLTENKSRDQLTIHVDPLLLALLQLGIGRQSAFFVFNAAKGSFVPRLEDFRLSGYSFDSCESVISKFVNYGNQIVHLRSFVERTYAQSSPSAVVIAAAATISSVSSTVIDRLYQKSLKVQSLLQLQSAYNRPGQLLHYLCDLVSTISGATSDNELLSRMFDFAISLDYSEPNLRPIFLRILSSISEPWLESISCSIGIQDRSLSADKHGRIQSLEGEAADEELVTQSMPRFMVPEDCENIFEARHALKLLQLHSPNDLVFELSNKTTLNAPTLEWHFGWSDIQKMETTATRYEARVLEAACSNEGSDMPVNHIPLGEEKASSDPRYDFDPFDNPRQQLGADELSLFAMPGGRSLHRNHGPTTSLLAALEEVLAMDSTISTGMDEFAPPLEIVPKLSFSSLISVQRRLLNQKCLQMLFKAGLCKHLQVQRRFHLLGDGLFTLRLAHALFDSELGSAERRKGYRRGGVMGLKLGARESWPPASSELRLALAGILNESYSSTSEADKMVTSSKELPGGLSFAIRDISEEEIQRIMDPNSIEALDFLRLQYKAPAPLDAILTVQCMEKYDAIFKLLLRVARMLFVVNQLSLKRISTSKSSVSSTTVASRFPFEARNFVSAVAEYFHHTIASIWNKFESGLLDLENRLDSPGKESWLGSREGLHQLRAQHEQTLDDISLALLMRKRQTQAMKLLEQIFGSILAFTKLETTGSRVASIGRGNMDLSYSDFQDNVRNFIRICKSLSEKPILEHNNLKTRIPSSSSSKQDNSSHQDLSVLAQLVLRLEMNQYYVLKHRQDE